MPVIHLQVLQAFNEPEEVKVDGFMMIIGTDGTFTLVTF